MKYLISHHWELVRETTEKLPFTMRVPQDAAKWLTAEGHHKGAQESFGVMVLNTRNRLVLIVEVSKGSINGSLVHPREVYRSAVMENAAGIICFHNHPSGDPSPSREDLELSKRLKDAGKVLGIELLDHVILSPDGRYVSLKEKELL